MANAPVASEPLVTASSLEDPGRRRLALAMLATVGTAFAGLQSIIVPALPQLRAGLEIDEASSAWILTASLLATSVFTPLIGSLGDTFGKKRLLLTATGIMLAGTVLSAVAPSLPLMLAGRAMQGIGGGIFPLAFAIVRSTFPPHYIAGGIGLVSSLLGIGGGLGLVVPGPIVDSFGYQWLFWFPAILTAVTIPGIIAWVPNDTVRRAGRVNVLSALLMSAGLVALLLGVSKAPAWGWASASFIGSMLLGGALISAWIVRELRSASPLIDLRSMSIRGVWISATAAAAIGFGMYSSFALFPAFAQASTRAGGLGETLTLTGFLMLPAAVTQLLTGPFIGPLDRLWGTRALLIASAALAASSFLWLAISHDHAWDLVVANAILGVGLGLGLPALANLVATAVPADQVGAAMGLNTVMRTIGGAIGGQVTLAVVAASPSTGDPANGYLIAFVICAATGMVALALASAAPRRAR